MGCPTSFILQVIPVTYDPMVVWSIRANNFSTGKFAHILYLSRILRRKQLREHLHKVKMMMDDGCNPRSAADSDSIFRIRLLVILSVPCTPIIIIILYTIHETRDTRKDLTAQGCILLLVYQKCARWCCSLRYGHGPQAATTAVSAKVKFRKLSCLASQ